MGKVSLLFSTLVFVQAAIYRGGIWRANVYFTASSFFISREVQTISKEFSKNTEAIKTAAEETKKTLRMYIK